MLPYLCLVGLGAGPEVNASVGVGGEGRCVFGGVPVFVGHGQSGERTLGVGCRQTQVIFLLIFVCVASENRNHKWNVVRSDG